MSADRANPLTARKRFSFLLGWALLLLFTTAPSPAMAQTGLALVRTDPVTLKVGSGQVETLHILLVGATDIYGIDLQATFDPAIVEVLDADSKRDGIQMELGSFLKPDFVVQNSADNQTGRLRYVATQINPTPPANGQGILLSINFRGKMIGAKTKLTFVSVQIADRHGVKQPVTAQGADLAVVPQKQPTRTPVPSATPVPTRTPSLTRTPALTPVPVTRTVSTATKIPSTLRPTFTTRPTQTVQPNDSAISARKAPVIPDQLLTILTAGSFSGSVVLFGLTFWLAAGRHRRERKRRSK